MKRIRLLFLVLIATSTLVAQTIPEHQSYSLVYDYIDELATDGYIELNSAIKPYSQKFIAQKLAEAALVSEGMSKRQLADLRRYINDFSLEIGKLPEMWLTVLNKKGFKLAFCPPSVYYADSLVRTSLLPILGMHVKANNHGVVMQRWYGVDFQMSIGKGFGIYASLRDVSQNRELLSKPEQYRRVTSSTSGLDTTMYYSGYLTNAPGGAYKLYDGTYSGGGDYSEMRGGVTYSWKWGKVGLVKDHIRWGDSYNCTNILSGRGPSFPMITFQIKPVKWFELNYIHGWLVSNQIDSTDYYEENTGGKQYRYRNKYIAANMFTFTPVKHLNLSFGNSIIYAEKTVQAAYLTPLMFFKSIDHTLTMGSENQNSQLFFNISSRNLKHTHFYASLFVDEFSIKRLSKSNPERNPISWKVGGKVSNFPLKNLSLLCEYTQNDIITYKHSIQALNYTSSGYGLGHYMMDNSRELYVAMDYKPVDGLTLKLTYLLAQKGNEYDYIRRSTDNVVRIRNIISQPFMNEMSWQNQTIGLYATYEVFKHTYAVLNVEYSDIRGYDLNTTPIVGELRLDRQGYLDMYTPNYLQGKTLTATIGLSFGF